MLTGLDLSIEGPVRLARIVHLMQNGVAELHLDTSKSPIATSAQAAHLTERPRGRNWFLLKGLHWYEPKLDAIRESPWKIVGLVRVSRVGWHPATQLIHEIHLEVDNLLQDVAEYMMQRSDDDRWYYLEGLESVSPTEAEGSNLAQKLSRDVMGRGSAGHTDEIPTRPGGEERFAD